MSKLTRNLKKLTLAGLLSVTAFNGLAAEAITLLNVSYDPTRELYREYNQWFSDKWQAEHDQSVNIRQSHGGSGSQARAVIDGLKADVVTLALAYDVEALREKADLIPADWQSKLAHNSSPYTSTIVLLVRKGNPKQIKDWDDLIREDVSVITPNPKTSGGARWNYLAAWGYALDKYGNEQAAYDFVEKLFKNVPVLDPGARASTNTFVQRGLGDVFIAWENEAFLAVEKLGKGQFEIIVPSISILAEPPVAVVEKNVQRKGTAVVAEAYLQGLYSDDAQRLAGRHYYRPSNPAIAAEFAEQFPDLTLFKVDEVFGGWQQAQEVHFSDGGKFDTILAGFANR